MTGKHLLWSLFFNKVAGLRPAKIKTLAQVLSCQFYEIFGKPFLQNISGRLLLVKKFNYVSLIFLNLQLFRTPPE